MKTALFLALVLCSCSQQMRSKLPAPPSPGRMAYYDSTFIKLHQEAAFNLEAKKAGRRFVSKKAVATVGISVFTIYCILAWRYDIE